MQIDPNKLNYTGKVQGGRQLHRSTESGKTEEVGQTDRLDRSQETGTLQRTKSFGGVSNNSDNREIRQQRFQHAGRSSGTQALNGAGFHSRIAGHSAHQYDLKKLAENVVSDMGLRTEFSAAAIAQAAAIKEAAGVPAEKLIGIEEWDKLSPAEKDEARKTKVVDMRSLLSSSIDNGDADKIVTSKDLDQLEASLRLPDGSIRMWVEIADVATVVPKGTPIDVEAIGDSAQVLEWFQQYQADPKTPTVGGNGFSIYTPGKVYPMLPEVLSTDLTSLNANVDRTAMIAEYTIAPDGSIKDETCYKGLVHSKAAMAYPGIGAWLDPNGDGVITEERGKVPGYLASAPEGIAEQVTMQAEASQKLKARREQNGSLTFADMETQAKLNPDGTIADIELHHATVSTQLIENLMVSGNGVASRFLDSKGFPTIQRVVKSPEKWDKIVERSEQIAKKYHVKADLPEKPDAVALREFLNNCKDLPDFPEISSSMVRLIGRGEYMAFAPGEDPAGHFCLAVDDYSHFTAPNRRGPDLVLHRMLQAAMAGEPCPYSMEELQAYAAHFTAQEGNIKKADRTINKIYDAAWLEQNNMFDKPPFEAIVSGVTPKGDKFVRATIPDPDSNKAPKRIEGFLKGGGKLEQGDHLKVVLTDLNVEKGKIEFTAAKN